MHYSNIKYNDIANGPGVRTVLFVSGCTHHCKGCFQPETWDFNHGEIFTPEIADELIESLKSPYIKGFTLLGGEPMEPANQEMIIWFLSRLKEKLGDKKLSIWCYTGDKFEDLIDENNPRHLPITNEILSYFDVLVDGEFKEELNDITLRFRGSSNQRLIDVPKSLKEGKVIEWIDSPIFSTHSMD